MTNPELKIADALREVTVAMQKAIDGGYRSRAVDADDLIEVLLSIADRLDPPIPNPGSPVNAADACPACGERNSDQLVWQDDDFVRCTTCGTIYAPAG